MNARVDPRANGEHINDPIFPNIDMAQIERFADALFKHTDPKGFVALRGFTHATNKCVIDEFIQLGDPQFFGVVEVRANQAATWPEPVVFCPPVATFKGTRNAKGKMGAGEGDVLEGVTLVAECDEWPVEAREKLTRWLSEPNIVMQSGGEWTNPETGEVEPKVHMHWRLKTPARTSEEIKLLKEARELVVKLVGGDPTATPPCHPFRWAGTWHTKGEPRLATIVSETENEIDLSEALEVLREESGSTLFGSHDPKGAKEKRAANPQDVARALEVIPNENLAKNI